MREIRKLIYERYFDLFIWRKLGVENLGNIRFIYTKKKRIFFILSWITIELFIYLIFHECF